MWPLSVLYDLVTRLRNHLYDSGYKPSVSFDRFTICIGNLNVGGSGKTPLTEYLIRHLQSQYKLGVVSRGYGRRTKGFRLASNGESAITIGDEPFQYYRKYGSTVAVAVGEERALAVPHLLHEHSDIDVVLLDDAFQHRAVQAHFSVLVTDFSLPFYQDHLLPMGRLREARKFSRRAQVIVVSKCPPDLTSGVMSSMRKQIGRYAGERPVFFSTIRYGDAISFGLPATALSRVTLLTGIAKTGDLVAYCQSRWELVHHFAYADHHRYTSEELKAVVAFARSNHSVLLTTEKDMVRLIGGEFGAVISQEPWFYVPIEIEFLKNGPAFDGLVRQSIQEFSNEHPVLS